MKYMLLTYLDEKAWLALPAEEQERQMKACGPHVEKLLRTSKLLAGGPLHPTTTATTLRNREGKRMITDGPFAETREQLGGYTIVEADDLDDAIAIAAGFLGESTLASIEVRPILTFDGTPAAPPRVGSS
ncbi:MAG: YciI family protein [Myxococcales bacterium]|nr:YciI family protein [Myxococcales bacterium]